MSAESIRGVAILPDGPAGAVIRYDPDRRVVTEVDATAVDAPEDLLIFPGFVDMHVHAREYPRPEVSDEASLKSWEAACRKEVFATAAQAAVNGGVTAFGAMPNDPIPPSDQSSYERKLALTKSAECDVILYAAITPTSDPWADLPYKLYLDSVPSSVNLTAWKDVEAVLDRYRGRRVFFHAEDPETLERFQGPGPRWVTRPPEAEIRAVDKILELTAKFGLDSHICHISTEAAVRLLEDYNGHSYDWVTSEVTPHHLYFSVEKERVLAEGKEFTGETRLLESNPPLRSEGDRRFLVDALKDGLIDALATDHAPHTLEDKRNRAPGMPHLDTVGAFAGLLMRDHGYSPVRVAEVLSRRPAEILRLAPAVQGIVPGAVASFTLLDRSASTRIEGAEIVGRGPLKTRCGWSPFSGVDLPAAVAGTVVRGRAYRS